MNDSEKTPQIQSSQVFANKATLCEHGDKEVLCQSCDEPLIFAMRDTHHEFSIGLTTILECLALAEKRGHVPPLPTDWWVLTDRRYDSVGRLRNYLFYQKE